MRLHIYSRADMLCFPSLFEGFGMPLVEAMAAGCPVACSNVTSIPEVTDAAAVLFNPHDPADIAEKIRRLLEDRDLREQLIEKGRKRAALFTVKRMAQKHIEAFDAAMEAYSRPRHLFNKYIVEPLHSFKMALKKK